MGVAAFPFHAPTVEIDATHPRVRFGVGPIRERLPLAGIADARPARDRWLYGQGIRTPHGGLHDVSGWEAAKIAPTSGRRLRPGTDEPYKCKQGGGDGVISIGATGEAENQQQEGGESNSRAQGRVRL